MGKSLIKYAISNSGFQTRPTKELKHPAVISPDGLEYWGNTTRGFILNLFRHDNMPYCFYPDGMVSFANFGIDEYGQIFMREDS